MKRLVVCCDGTWADADSSNEFTNVVRITRAITAQDTRSCPPISQIVYYHSGVGTGGDAFDQLAGGSIGLGLSRNIRDAYAFLANNYCEGDEIFLFGFSRGAYTVRSLGGLIGWAGILHKPQMDDFALLWEGYRLKKTEDQAPPDCFKNGNDPDQNPHFPVPVKCIGVWDTVGALGIPGHVGDLFTQFYQFHDTNLGVHVENAFQALALDEHRADFAPTLWAKAPDGPPKQNLLQVWFAGAHSNVGGGYDEHGLSDVALAWMASQVDPLLQIDPHYLSTRQDQRNAWALGKIYNSATGIFELREKINRKVMTSGEDDERIHESVQVRLNADATPNGGPYKPPSLAAGLPNNSVTPLGPLEITLKWPGPNPAQTGKTSCPEPDFLHRLLNRFT